ncbi:MAG: thiamine pyrophosphate-dependent dehydrogenase E1 component subunit alpha, partial [Ginsengibacter sp.]
MLFQRNNLSEETLIDLYKKLLLPRLIEEKMLLLLRQGKISKWFSGMGQEAISVGVTSALQADEWIMPLHRNLGVFTGRKMPLHKLFQQWQGAENGYSKGRERSFHFGSKEHFICGMISHLGPQLAVADGVSLGYKLKKEEKVSVAFTGEGGTSEGDFHEALNVAAVWNLPVIFIIENNGYALSTPVNEQYNCKNLVDKAQGYGIEGTQIDGNNILEVYETLKRVRDYCITNQKPFLVECMTFRMRGHEEASGVKYVPKEIFAEWIEKDPIKNYERFLLEEKVFDNLTIAHVRNELKDTIDAELKKNSLSNDEKERGKIFSNSVNEVKDVYAPLLPSDVSGKKVNFNFHTTVNKERKEFRFVDAIKEGLRQSMVQHSNLILMGQDIA